MAVAQTQAHHANHEFHRPRETATAAAATTTAATQKVLKLQQVSDGHRC